MATITHQEFDFVAASCQREEIKTERQFEEFSSSLKLSPKSEVCVDEVCINTSNHEVCWFSVVPECSNVEYMRFSFKMKM